MVAHNPTHSTQRTSRFSEYNEYFKYIHVCVLLILCEQIVIFTGQSSCDGPLVKPCILYGLTSVLYSLYRVIQHVI